MNELRRRVRRLEDSITPNEKRRIFFWKGKETEQELAKLSPEERERAIVFQWVLDSDFDEAGPIDETEGLDPELKAKLDEV